MANDFGLTLDHQKTMAEILDAVEKELQQLGDRFIDIAKREVTKTTYGGAPGREDWRNDMAENMKKFPIRYENGYMILPVGLDLQEGTSVWIRALVITFGSGHRAQTDGGTGLPIHARPMETVWDSEMTGERISDAWTPFFLPDQFNQTGNMWLENTVRQIEPDIADLQKRIPDIVAAVITRNIRNR